MIESVQSVLRAAACGRYGPLSADSKLADPNMTRRIVSDVSSCLSTSWVSGCLGLHSQQTSRPASAVLNHPNAAKRRMPQTQQTQTQPNANAAKRKRRIVPNAEWCWRGPKRRMDKRSKRRSGPKRRQTQSPQTQNAAKRKRSKRRMDPNAAKRNAAKRKRRILCLAVSVFACKAQEAWWASRIGLRGEHNLPALPESGGGLV